MNLFDLNTNNITMNIDGQNIAMKPAICYDQTYDNWLVSECGKIWSKYKKKVISPYRDSKGYRRHEIYTKEDFWEDGGGRWRKYGDGFIRDIKLHKVVIDTWKPLYDNPPVGIVWEEWKKVRDLPTVYDHISKTIVIDHINNIKFDNRLDNLRRTTTWDNQKHRKVKGI